MAEWGLEDVGGLIQREVEVASYPLLLSVSLFILIITKFSYLFFILYSLFFIRKSLLCSFYWLADKCSFI